MKRDWVGWRVPSLRGYPCLHQSLGVLDRLGVVLGLGLERGRHQGLGAPGCLRLVLVLTLERELQLHLGVFDCQDLEKGLGKGFGRGREMCALLPHPPLRYLGLGLLVQRAGQVTVNVQGMGGLFLGRRLCGTVGVLVFPLRSSRSCARFLCWARLLLLA